MIDFAKANGYDFTLAELEAYQKQPQGIPCDELDAVSGGLFYSTCICVGGGCGVDDDENGFTCACAFFGGGRQDKTGNQLLCPFIFGTITIY